MSQIYSYTTADFSGGLHISQLQAEIVDNTTITTTISHINTNADDIDIVFQSSLSAPELTELNDVVIPNHVPIPPNEPVILEKSPTSDIITAQIGSDTAYFPAQYSQTVYISQEEKSGQYTTIRAALDANPIPNTIFLVQPGTYIENNPLILPISCLLVGAGTAAQTTVVAANPASNLIVINPWSKVDSMVITGATSACGIYFDGSVAPASAYALFEECIITNCDTLVRAENGPNTLLGYRSLVSASSSGSSPSRGLHASAGAQMTLSSVSVAGSPSPYVPIMDGIVSEGAGTKVSLSTSNVYVCNRGVVEDDDGEIELNLLTARGNVTSFYVGPTGTNCKIRANSFSMLESVLYDIDIQAADADIGLFSSEIDESKINNPNHIKFINQSHTNKYHKIFKTHAGDIRFGGREQKTTVSIGEGKYDDSKMVVLTNDNLEAGTWIDHTIAAKDYEVPGFGIFQSTAINNCCYIGRDNTLVGCKVNITTATSSTTTKDDVIWECWDGSSWVPFNVLVTQAEMPFYYIMDSVVSTVGKYHIRFPAKSSDAQPTKDLNGHDLKWVRMRVVNTLSSIPHSQYVKLHVNQRKINSAGFVEKFGDGRVSMRLPWTINDTEPANASPDNQDVYLSDQLGVGRRENRFKDGVVDRLGANIFLPEDLDNSFPMKLKFAIIGDSSTDGDVEFVARWNTSNAGSSVYRTTSSAPSASTGEKSASTIITITDADTEYRGEIELDLNRVNPYPSSGTAEMLWLSFERDATGGNANDTYPGNVTIAQISPFYMAWREGGFIDAF